MTRPKHWSCRQCGEPFSDPERSVRYCSSACREAARRERVRRENARNKRLSDEAKLLRGCVTCGYRRSARALHWHHVDPSTKEVMVRGSSHLRTGRIATERDTKCVLLCANCHYERHEVPA